MVNRRNSPCDCGSDKKHKVCCMKDPTKGAKQVNIKVNASMQELRRAVATVESKTILTMKEMARGKHKGGFR